MSKLRAVLGSMLTGGTAKDIFLLVGVYAVCYGLMLLNPGIYWDDWQLSVSTWPKLIYDWGRCGGSLTIHIAHFLLNLENAVLVGHLLIFMSYCGGMVFLYLFLREIKILKESQPFWLSLLIATFPVNQGRLALMLLGYAVCYCFFTMGMWLTMLWVRRPGFFLRVGALSFFFLSFFANSFLVLYAVVPIILLIGSLRKFPRNPKSLIVDLFQRVDFFAFPVIFWLLRTWFFAPDAGFAYNGIHLMSLQHLILNLTNVFHDSFLSVFELAFGQADGSLARSVLLSFAIAVLFRAMIKKLENSKWKIVAVVGGLLCMVCYLWGASPFPLESGFPVADFFLIITCLFLIGESLESGVPMSSQGNDQILDGGLILCGGGLFFLGVFPYIVVSKPPHPVGFDSRWELLIPFGAGFMVYGAVRLVSSLFKFRAKYHKVLVSVLVVFFALLNIRNLFLWQCDYYKQCSIMAQLRLSPPPVRLNSKILLVWDATQEVNPWEHNYDNLEWEGIIRFALTCDKPIGTDYWKLKWMDYRDVRRKDEGLQFFVTNRFDSRHRPCLVIAPPKVAPFGEQDNVVPFPTRWRKDCLHLMWLELFSPENFQKKIGEMVNINWICTCELNEKNRHRPI